MNVRHLIARTPADDAAALREAEKQAFADSMDQATRSRHGRIGRRPAWLLARLGLDSRMAEWRARHRRAAAAPELGGRARHVAYRAAKQREHRREVAR